MFKVMDFISSRLATNFESGHEFGSIIMALSKKNAPIEVDFSGIKEVNQSFVMGMCTAGVSRTDLRACNLPDISDYLIFSNTAALFSDSDFIPLAA